MAAGSFLPSRQFFTGKQCVCSTRSNIQSVHTPVRQPLTVARAGLPSIGMMGTKAGMTQIFRDGLAIPASVIALDEGNIVTQVSISSSTIPKLFNQQT